MKHLERLLIVSRDSRSSHIYLAHLGHAHQKQLLLLHLVWGQLSLQQICLLRLRCLYSQYHRLIRTLTLMPVNDTGVIHILSILQHGWKDMTKPQFKHIMILLHWIFLSQWFTEFLTVPPRGPNSISHHEFLD